MRLFELLQRNDRCSILVSCLYVALVFQLGCEQKMNELFLQNVLPIIVERFEKMDQQVACLHDDFVRKLLI